jgi:hypothetical protein
MHPLSWPLRLLSDRSTLDTLLAESRSQSITVRSPWAAFGAVDGMDDLSWRRLPRHQIRAEVDRDHQDPPLIWALVRVASRLLCWGNMGIALQGSRLLEWRERCAHRVDLGLLRAAWVALDILPRKDLRPDYQTELRSIDEAHALRLLDGPAMPTLDEPLMLRLRRMGLVDVHRHATLSLLPEERWVALLSGQIVDGDRRDARMELTSHARRLRRALQAWVDPRLVGGQDQDAPAALRSDQEDQGSPAALRAALHGSTRPGLAQSDGPITDLYKSDDADPFQRGVVDERRLIWLCLRRIVERPTDVDAAHALHAYVLRRSAFHSELVQHPDTKGFDRFKREHVDHPWHQERRTPFGTVLKQANGSGAVSHMELKFTPKAARASLDDLSNLDGSRWYHLGAGSQQAHLQERLERLVGTEDGRPGTTVVLHFLRAVDTPPPAVACAHTVVRHHQLRHETWSHAAAVHELQQELLGAPIVALDVASDELAAGVEVFAPAIRALRSVGRHIPQRAGVHELLPRRLALSVHAGEEFRHILSGMRAIDETVHFLDMVRGDRLGHALAVGVDPAAWQARNAGRTVQPRGERLDDLVWWRRWLKRVNAPGAVLLGVDEDILRHAHDLKYRTEEIAALEEAWLWRAEDPLMVDRDGVGKEVAPLRREAARSLERARSGRSEASFALWRRYHADRDLRRLLDTPVEVNQRPDEASWIRVVQDAMLAQLEAKSIAIEINPSSNLTIGPFDALTDHPVFRWRPPEIVPNAPRPTVLVGSDDPAIFGSELLSEYALLAAAARERGYPEHLVEAWVVELAEAGHAWRFRSSLEPDARVGR